MPEPRHLLRPRAVGPGSRVSVVAPASACTPAELDAGVAELRALGFEPVFDERLIARRGYVAGDAAIRAAAFRDAIRDPSTAAVIGLRGGYGSVHVLPRIDAAEIAAARKPIVGYSDLTSLLTFVVQQAGLVAFHGPTLAQRLGGGTCAYDRDTFLRAIGDPAPLGPVTGPMLRVLRPGTVEGPLVGGTLTVLAASLATPYAFDPPPGCVMFLEDVNERPYRLDRMLTQLAMSGRLTRAAGIVFGELTGCDEPGGAVSAAGVVADILSDFPGPVLIGLPSGHTPGPALTLPLGVRVRLEGSGSPAVVFVESGVE